MSTETRHRVVRNARVTSRFDVEPVVRNNLATSRFDVYVDGQNVGHLQYEMHQGEIWLLNTFVDRHYAKTGVEQALIRAALQDAHRSRLAVVPFCLLTRAFLNTQPKYLRLVPPVQRERFNLLLSRSVSAHMKHRTKQQPAGDWPTGKTVAA